MPDTPAIPDVEWAPMPRIMAAVPVRRDYLERLRSGTEAARRDQAEKFLDTFPGDYGARSTAFWRLVQWMRPTALRVGERGEL